MSLHISDIVSFQGNNVKKTQKQKTNRTLTPTTISKPGIKEDKGSVVSVWEDIYVTDLQSLENRFPAALCMIYSN